MFSLYQYIGFNLRTLTKAHYLAQLMMIMMWIYQWPICMIYKLIVWMNEWMDGQHDRFMVMMMSVLLRLWLTHDNNREHGHLVNSLHHKTYYMSLKVCMHVFMLDNHGHLNKCMHDNTHTHTWIRNMTGLSHSLAIIIIIMDAIFLPINLIIITTINGQCFL